MSNETPQDVWILESRRPGEDWAIYDWYRSKERAEAYRAWSALYYESLNYEYRIIRYVPAPESVGDT